MVSIIIKGKKHRCDLLLSAVKELRSDKGERLQLYTSGPSHVVIHCPNKETYAILREPRNALLSTECSPLQKYQVLGDLTVQPVPA